MYTANMLPCCRATVGKAGISRIVRGSGNGQPAPDFRYRDDEGQVASLSDLRGKPVVLNFWASWCPPCRAEMPLIEAAYRDQSWKEKGVQFLTVNLDDDPSRSRQLMSDSGYSFPFVLDATSSIGEAYNVYGIPSTFFIDSKGVIVLTKVGAFADGAELDKALKKLTS